MAPISNAEELLARVNFPPYTVKMLTNRHILVAGGGGKAKTGIANAVKIYELSHDGKRCRAESSSHYDTGDTAIMNCATYHNGKYFVLAAGQEAYCHLYQITFKVTTPEDEGEVIGNNSEGAPESGVRQRQHGEGPGSKIEEIETQEKKPTKERKPKNDKNRNSVSSFIGFNFQPLQSVQTDFHAEDPFQKIVRVAGDCKFMVTGGADGHLRIWQLPSLKQIHSVAAHKDEVDDLDISPTGKQILSVSRDGHAYLWKAKELELQCELAWSPSETEKYRYRNCRFCIVEGDKVNCCAFTSHIPVVRQKKQLPSYLVKWDTGSFLPKRVQATGTEVLSSMAVSDDGRFVAVGTMSGSVDIFISFSLQHLLHSEAAHSFFITGLEFVPTSDEMAQVTGDYDASVISVSVDNQIKIHHIPKQATISVFWVLLMLVVVLLFVFSLMSYLGL